MKYLLHDAAIRSGIGLGRLSRSALAVVPALILAGGTATAVAQALPPSAEPGRLEQRFEPPLVPQSQPPVQMPAPEQAPPPEKAGSVKLTLRDIIVDGVTVYGKDEISKYFRDFIGKQISLLDVYNIRDAITARYRNDGYILSQALIPAQKIENGVVRLRVVEGYIDQVTIHGGVTDRLGLIETYAARIKAARPLTNAVLERYVLLMDDLPGTSVRTVLQPAKGDSLGANLDIEMTAKPLGASVTADNRGTHAVGPLQIEVEGTAGNVFGLFENTTLRAIGTTDVSELRYLDVSHVLQLGLDGATLELGARRSWSEPGDVIRPFEIESRNTTFRSVLSYPLLRSRSETLRLTGGFTFTNARTESFDSRFSDDRIRYLSLGATYDVADSLQGSNLFRLGLSQGLDILNATDAGKGAQSRDRAHADFTKLTASVQRIQPLPGKFSVVVGAEGQYSPGTLVSGEQYGLGGKLYGRAFDSSEVTGDVGLSGKVEIQYTPDFGIPRLDYVQFFTYGDVGAVWNHDRSNTRGGTELASVGAGFRVGFSDTLSGSFEIGKPLLRDSADNGDRSLRGFFELKARY